MNTKILPLMIAAVIAVAAILLAACDNIRVISSTDSGPRSTGYSDYASQTPHNHRVIYDSSLGMYVVLGLLSTYWNGSNYYRLIIMDGSSLMIIVAGTMLA